MVNRLGLLDHKNRDIYLLMCDKQFWAVETGM
jgi:hypothetical protein